MPGKSRDAKGRFTSSDKSGDSSVTTIFNLNGRGPAEIVIRLKNVSADTAALVYLALVLLVLLLSQGAF